MTEDRVKGTSAPLCKICDHRHWMREPHIFGSTKAPKVVALDVAKKLIAATPEKSTASGRSPSAGATAPRKTKAPATRKAKAKRKAVKR